MKIWIVYMTPDKKIEAVEDEFNGQTLQLVSAGNQILGHPAFKRKQDAIDYISQLIF